MVSGKDESLPVLISQRVVAGGHVEHLAYGAWNEAEDVLALTAGARIEVLDRHSDDRPIQVRRVLGRAARRAIGGSFLVPPTAAGPSMDDVSHVFFIAHGLWDLAMLERLRALRRRDVSISVWISEVWPSELGDPRVRLECYSLIDHVFVAVDEAAEPFADIAPRASIHVLPPAVDVLRFAPPDPFGSRGIAVLGIGRRDPEQHRELLDWARNRRALYVYDTVKGQAEHWEEHREALASWYQHTSVAICNHAKHDVPRKTDGLRVLPGRLFEGLAAGAVLVGLPPDEARQQQLFGTTVVEPLHNVEHELSDVLDRFCDPGEALQSRVRNLGLACRGHDWSHRWRTAYEAIGLPVPLGIENRIENLAKKADEYEELADSR